MNKQTETIDLYAVEYSMAGYLLELIDSAIWLSKNSKLDNLNKINIILLPKPINYTRNSLLKDLFVKLFSVIPEKKIQLYQNNLKILFNFKIIQRYEFNKKILILLDKMLNFSKEAKIKNQNSFFNLISKKKKVSFNIENIQIDIFKKKYHKLELIKNLIISTITAIRLYYTCYTKLKFNSQKFLNLHDEQIHIGDLIASFNVRINPSHGGQFKSSFGLFIDLINGLYLNRLASNLKLSNKKNQYINPSEPFYSHHIWVRNLLYRGMFLLQRHNPLKKYEILDVNSYHNPWIAKKPQQDLFDRDRAIMHLNQRIFEPTKIIDSFSKSNFVNNNSEKNLYDDNGNKLIFSNEELFVTIFLHDFSDALYADGLDGFNDLSDWTSFTIDKLLENTNIKKVCIKSHPSADFISSRANIIAYKIIKKKYYNNHKIIFLNKNSSIVSLSAHNFFCGITHHGNIALELTHLDIPVIAWINGPWGEYYNFLNKWDHKTDYENILLNLKKENCNKPGLKEKDDLYKYIDNYELERIKPEKKSLRLFITSEISGYFRGNHLDYEKIVKELNTEDYLFREIINQIYRRVYSKR